MKILLFCKLNVKLVTIFIYPKENKQPFTSNNTKLISSKQKIDQSFKFKLNFG